MSWTRDTFFARQDTLSAMAPIEAQALVNARGSTVWDVLTDSRNFTVWDSGIESVSGEIRNGGTITVRTRQGGAKGFRVRVEQIPDEVMTRTRAVPAALGTSVRTFVLTHRDGMTLLLVRDEIKGPLRGFFCSPFSSTQQDLDDLVTAVKKRAEALG